MNKLARVCVCVCELAFPKVRWPWSRDLVQPLILVVFNKV